MFFTQLITSIQLNFESLLAQVAKQSKRTSQIFLQKQQQFFRSAAVAQDMQRS
jgi:hypothetical protein